MKKSAIITALLLSGCAVFDHPNPYIWFDSGHPKLDVVRWETHPLSHIQHACGFTQTLTPENSLHAGCAVRLNNSGQPYCLVLSNVTEDVAKQIIDPVDGKTVYEHEAGEHCRNALDHWRKL